MGLNEKGFHEKEKKKPNVKANGRGKERVKKADSGVTTASKLMRAKRDWKWALLI